MPAKHEHEKIVLDKKNTEKFKESLLYTQLIKQKENEDDRLLPIRYERFFYSWKRAKEKSAINLKAKDLRIFLVKKWVKPSFLTVTSTYFKVDLQGMSWQSITIRMELKC